MTRRSDPQHRIVDTACSRLAEQGTTLYYTHQNIAELWNATIRPIERNGLGLSVSEAQREVIAIESGMNLLLENEQVYRERRKIVVRYSVSGVQVHDARLAAAMYVHGVREILTLNSETLRT
jgi:predicted nucleic acid-binding protein